MENIFKSSGLYPSEIKLMRLYTPNRSIAKNIRQWENRAVRLLDGTEAIVERVVPPDFENNIAAHFLVTMPDGTEKKFWNEMGFDRSFKTIDNESI